MNRSEIIALIGERRFADACAEARRAARDPHYGSRQEQILFDSMVPHEISDLVWESQIPSQDKLDLILRFYEEMPCYALLMYLKFNFDELSAQDRAVFWAWVRTQLDSDDPAVGQPVAYALWCDFFQDPQTVEEAWRELVEPLPSDKALQTILIHSGPVPFYLKKQIYSLLIKDSEWHYYIYRSLLHSQFDVYGQLNKREARKFLAQLDLPSDTEYLDELKMELTWHSSIFQVIRNICDELKMKLRL